MVALMSLPTPSSAAGANAERVMATVPTTVPTTVLTLTPLWPVRGLRDELQGSLCRTDSCAPVGYPSFVTASGVKMLADRISAATDISNGMNAETVVFGYSHGATVAARWMQQNADDLEAPSPDRLSFVLIGNPHRAHGNSLPPIPQTRYQVIDIVRQYDPVADYPDRFNLLALLNVSTSILSPIHLDYTDVDIDDPANTVWTEGNVTYVFVPTQNLPLLGPLRLVGLGWLADALNEPLKEIIEQAYDRPYLATEPATTSAETAASDGTAAATGRQLEDTGTSDVGTDVAATGLPATDLPATSPPELLTAARGDRPEEISDTAEDTQGTAGAEDTESATETEQPAEATDPVETVDPTDDREAIPDQEPSTDEGSDDVEATDQVEGNSGDDGDETPR